MPHTESIEEPTGFNSWPLVERQEGSLMDVAFFVTWRERLEQMQHVAPCWPVDHSIVPGAGQTANLGVWQDLTNLVGLSPTKMYVPPFVSKLVMRFYAGLNYDHVANDSVKISFRFNVNDVYSTEQTIWYQPVGEPGVDGVGIAAIRTRKYTIWPDPATHPDGVPVGVLDTVQTMKLEYRFDILLGSGGDPIQKFFLRNDFGSGGIGFIRPWYWFVRPLKAEML